MAFYRLYANTHPQAKEAGPVPPEVGHKCQDSCPTWSHGDTHLCLASGNVHECDGIRPCSLSIRTHERFVCVMTGQCTTLDLDYESAIFTTHHGTDAKKLRVAFNPDERSSHGQLDQEHSQTRDDIHRLRAVILDTTAALLKGVQLPHVWRVCTALWRLLPVTGGQKHDGMLVHVLTVFHLMTSDLVISEEHVVWRACPTLRELLPPRRSWAKYKVCVTSRRVTHREVAIRAAIADAHLGPGACCDIPCSVVS